MVNIMIYQNGDVTGDKGKIIAYEGQTKSEVINITHPLFTGAKYSLEYRYGQTIYKNQLDSNNNVQISVGSSGYVRCQLVAEDIISGDILFKSNPWNLLIKESLKTEASHYPCSSEYHHHEHGHVPPKHSNCNGDFNAYEAFYKLLTELRNEEDVRFSETRDINQTLYEIKQYLNLTDAVASNIDADTVTTPGSYLSSVDSTNFPKTGVEFRLIVSKYGENNSILQQAYEINSNNIYYRSSLADEIEWTDWAQLEVQL